MTYSPASARQLAWRAVGLLWIVFFLNYMDRQIAFSMFPVLKRDLAFSDTQLGLLGSLFTWTYSLCMPFTGRLSDILSRKWMVVASLVLWSSAMIGTATSTSVEQFLFWRVLMGVVESLYVPAAYGLIAGLHTDTTRARAFALHSTAQLAGIVGGGWFGGWSGESIGWRHGYVLMGAVGIAYALVLVPAFRRIPAGAGDPEAAGIIDPARSWKRPPMVLKSVTYRFLLLATPCFSFTLWLGYAWLPSHVYERFHVSLAQSGLIATLFIQISSAVGVLAGGYIADRWSVRHPEINCLIVAMGGLSGPLLWATFSAKSLLALKVAAIAYGFCSGLHVGNVFPAAAKVVEPADFGFAAGFLNLLGGLSGGAGMLIGGRLKATVGVPWLTGVASIGCILAGIALAIHAIHAAPRMREQMRARALAAHAVEPV